jgi:two-component system, NarL family, response regulator DevR
VHSEREDPPTPRVIEPIRVFVVDDHSLVRRALRDLLTAEDDMELAGEAATLDAARVGIGEQEPDVVVLDLRFPEGSGLDLCLELRDKPPQVLVVTSSADPREVLEAVEAGATGYLLKSADSDEYLQAVRDVAGGRSVVDPAVVGQLLDRIKSPSAADRLDSLTAQERRILDHLSEGMSNRDIASKVGTTEKTVKNHMSGILRKLGLENRTQAALFMAERRGRPSHPEQGEPS